MMRQVMQKELEEPEMSSKDFWHQLSGSLFFLFHSYECYRCAGQTCTHERSEEVSEDGGGLG